MSSFEPPTSAKVIFETSKGPICIELWAKETPKTSRNFLSNCLNNVYKGCQFNKIIPNFIIQSSSPPVFEQFSTEVELHQRLRFNRRGLVGYVGGGTDEFFITTGNECDELNNKKYTLFGKIVDNTIFNVAKINESELDTNGEPLYPTVIKNCQVVISFFDNLVLKNKNEDELPTVRKKRKVVKNKNKISFEDEDLADDERVVIKSAHELLRNTKGATTQPEQKQEVLQQLQQQPKEQDKKEAPDETEAKESVIEKMKLKYKLDFKDKTKRDADTMAMLDKYLHNSNNNNSKWL